MMSLPTLAGGLAAVALSAAACSSGGNGNSVPSPATASSTSATSPAAAASASCPANSGLSGNVSDRGAAAANGPTIEVEAGDFFFLPTCVTSTPSGTVSLVVRNTGVALHNVTIEAQGIDTDVAPGETITVQLNIDQEAVPYVCKYHRTSGMVGSLIPTGS